MRKTHNGFVTLFVTWLGFVVFSFSLAVAVLAERHWQEVRTFSHATRAAYLAESALEIGKERYSQKTSRFLLLRETLVLKDIDGLQAGEAMRVQFKAKNEKGILQGTLRGIGSSPVEGKDGLEQMEKTCAVPFTAVYDTTKRKWNFTFGAYKV